MEDTNIVLCKIKFRKGNTGNIRTEIGFLNEEDNTQFFTDENNYIQFTNKV